MSARMARKTATQLDAVKRTLASGWSATKKAGAIDDQIDIASTGTHSCGARVTLNNGNIYKGAFDSDGLHAEMDALEKLVTAGEQLANITSIEIEKEPCPRCAVALNGLALAGVVRYKALGQKDYPTWRYPSVGVIWSIQLGIGAQVSHDADVQELLTYFQTNKWWT
jgi:hypothetical protein